MQRVNDREVQREGGGTNGPKKEVCGAHQVGNVDPGLFAHGERGQESLSSHLKTRIKKGVPHGVPNTVLPPIYTRFPATQGVVPERVLGTVTGRAEERGRVGERQTQAKPKEDMCFGRLKEMVTQGVAVHGKEFSTVRGRKETTHCTCACRQLFYTYSHA